LGNKANLLIEIQKNEEALQILNKIIEDPSQIKYRSIKAELLAASKNWEEALNTISECINLDPNNLEYKSKKAIWLLESGRKEESSQFLNILTRENPNNDMQYK